MQPHQQRVVDEKEELDLKLVKLSVFLGTKMFSELPIEEKRRLRHQEEVMQEYSKILSEHIAAFPSPSFTAIP